MRRCSSRYLFETQIAVGRARMFPGGFIFFLVVELEKLIIRTVRHSRSAPLPAESAA
jgi:hypothetical protein